MNPAHPSGRLCSKEGCLGFVTDSATPMNVEIPNIRMKVMVPKGVCHVCFIKQFSLDFATWRERGLFRFNDVGHGCKLLCYDEEDLPIINWEALNIWWDKAAVEFEARQAADRRTTLAPHPAYSACCFLRSIGVMSNDPSGNHVLLDRGQFWVPRFNESGLWTNLVTERTQCFYFTTRPNAVVFAQKVLGRIFGKDPIEAYQLVN